MSFASSFGSFNRDFSAATSRNVTPSTNNVKRKREDLAASTVKSTSATPVPTQSQAVTNTTYSQPQDTGTGQAILTQVVYAIDHLKSKEKPLTFDEIWNYLSIPPHLHNHKPILRKALLESPRVYFQRGEGGKQGTYEFRSIHNVRSGEELVALLQRQKTAQGIHVKDLKDGWPTAIKEIMDLDKEGRVLVTLNKKDNVPKMVWINDPSLAMQIDEDFQNMWNKIKLPGASDELRNELEKANLTPTSQIKEVEKVTSSNKKKRIVRKIGRSTNTHMAGILKDYASMRR